MNTNTSNNPTYLMGTTYHVVTFGCQMNKSDSERIAGMLDALGALPSTGIEDADLIVFMTCCVREAADERLYGQVASLKNANAFIAVGGCIGQRDAAALVEKMPHINVVFGTHNLAHLPALIAQAHVTGKPVVEVVDTTDEAANARALDGKGTAPRREQAWHAWLPIMTGCNNFCSYCIVPYVRGREHSLPFNEVVDEAKRLVDDGVREITLLGQNVNSYGRDISGKPQFAELLAAISTVGIERLRFATSHPKDLLPQTIEVFASTPAIMPALHLPVQSGSSRILKEMNRHYTAQHYLELVEQVKEASRGANKGPVAFSTDIIVGFPGETDEDFEQTLALVKEVGYAQAFTFIYSKRAGTPAAKLVDDTPRQLIQERFENLVELVQQGAWDFNQQFCGQTLPVLFEGVSKRNETILTGRGPQNQTVHAELPAGQQASSYAGTIHPVAITEAKTWYLSGSLS